MNLTPRRPLSGLLTVLLVAATLAAAAPAATAHPLGNFTVNHYTGLTLRPDGLDAVIVVDRAEIAAAQERPRVDRDHDGRVSAQESETYARTGCTALADQLNVSVRDSALSWRGAGSTHTYRPGDAGLKTSRLQCAFTAETDLGSTADIEVRTAYDSRRIGWREITARGRGVTLTASDVPVDSVTDELRTYPQDPLATPLDQRSASLRAQPGSGSAASAVREVLPASGPVGAALDKVSGVFDSLIAHRELTVPVGLLAVLLAVVLGASHAAMPGHGKTIMAAYLAGRRGTPRDAVTVGATVTLTHTAGVLVLGLLLPLVTGLAGEAVLTWLGLASGLLVTAIGLWLLRSALLKRPAHHHHHGHHHHGHSHHHHHDSDHHTHEHDEKTGGHQPVGLLPGTRAPDGDQAEDGSVALLSKTHHHTPARPDPPAPARTTRGGLVGMGVAGGLVPSPSALVVLLGAVALGRTVFGVLLVLAYGVGMAVTLTLAGLVLVRLRDRIEAGLRTAPAARWTSLKRLARCGPVATSGLVLLVGIGLTARAVAGPW
ncbi:nickel/cobalt transporter [Streptomyces hypolithicus]